MTDRALTTAQVLQGLGTVRGVLAPDLNDEELRLFAMVANRSGLDPFAKQIYALKRKGRVTFQTGIDGYRSIAARTGMYDGQDEPEYGPVCECGDNRPAGHPEFATVRVYRKGVTRAIAATAYWHEYKPGAGQSGHGDDMWMKMPRVMIAKVAEALALRKAFPYDPENRQGIGADIYTADEMSQAGDPAPRAPQQSLAEKAAAKRAAVEEAVYRAEDDPKRFTDAALDADATPEPVAAPEQPTDSTVCGEASPYGEGSEPCNREQGHKGNHKNHDRESW
jgi:phage recombination protein Bet